MIQKYVDLGKRWNPPLPQSRTFEKPCCDRGVRILCGSNLRFSSVSLVSLTLVTDLGAEAIRYAAEWVNSTHAGCARSACLLKTADGFNSLAPCCQNQDGVLLPRFFFPLTPTLNTPFIPSYAINKCSTLSRSERKPARR